MYSQTRYMRQMAAGGGSELLTDIQTQTDRLTLPFNMAQKNDINIPYHACIKIS